MTDGAVYCMWICSTAMVEIWLTTCKVRLLLCLCVAKVSFVAYYDKIVMNFNASFDDHLLNFVSVKFFK